MTVIAQKSVKYPAVIKHATSEYAYAVPFLAVLANLVSLAFKSAE
jgi:hypothetical protein